MRRPLSIAIPIMGVLVVALGCPGFEDEYSGTYRQVVSSDETGDPGFPDQIYALELFRYGNDVQALLRTYDASNPGTDPFSVEERCDWTDPTELDLDAGEFETQLRSGTTRFRLSGRLIDDGEMLVRINSSTDAPMELNLESFTEVPNATCRTIAPMNMFADFAGQTQANAFEEGVYELREPYFGVQWLAVEPRRRDGGLSVFAALSQELVAAPVGAQKVTENGRGLRGQLHVRLEPPRDEIRTFSGSTRYSMAYFVVVDDRPDDDGPFVWDVNSGEEPIVASSVRRGERPDAPDFVTEHNQFGLAVLFVEDRLDDLDPRLTAIMEGFEEMNPEEHFYLVQVFATDDRVTGLRFPEQDELKIPVIITTDYLAESGIPLPRLFPR